MKSSQTIIFVFDKIQSKFDKKGSICTIAYSYLHMCKLPDQMIKVISFNDLNKSVKSFSK